MKHKKNLQDMFLMLFFMVLAAVMIWVVIPGQIKVTAVMEKEVMTPRTFPYLASAGILVISAVGFISSLVTYLKERAADTGTVKEKKTRQQWMESLFPYFIFLLIVVYGALFYQFGIVIASLIVPPLILFALGCRKWYMYVILYAFFGIMYTLFTVVLHVPIK